MPDTSYDGAMRRALALAERGRWNACPNPTVGAVLLRDGRIVAEGYHRAAGEPHAEIECLADARARGIDPRGATMAVTLEPCNHHGKTPPCSEALIAAGITRVVFGLRDPNPRAAGGLERLLQAGIEVTGPVLEQECRDLVADFLVWQTEQRPYVILKLASTLDGRISTRNRQRQQISNAASHHNVHLLRAGVGHCGGAVLIGGGTFRADNPALTARTVPTDRQPLACILTSRLPQPTADFQLLRDRPQDTVFFVSPAACASTVAHALGEKGVRVFSLGPGINGRPDFPALFKLLRQDLGCPYILCEGGGKLGTALLESGFVDEFHLHLSPRVLGDNEAAPLLQGRSPASMDEAIGLRVTDVRLCDGDVHLSLRPTPQGVR